MMIDATVAPKVGFISPFGTTVCTVNHISAGGEPSTLIDDILSWIFSCLFWNSVAAIHGLDHGVGHHPAASGPCHSTAAPEARRGRGCSRDAERSHMAEKVRKA